MNGLNYVPLILYGYIRSAASTEIIALYKSNMIVIILQAR